jgi:hypothetical protein
MFVSAEKVFDVLADIRIDPTELGKRLAYQQSGVQERAYKMFVGFIRELALQDAVGGYVNENFEIAQRGRAIEIHLTDTELL